MTSSWQFAAFPSCFNQGEQQPRGDCAIFPQQILEDIHERQLSEMHLELTGNLHSKVCSTPLCFYLSEEPSVFLPEWMFQNLYLQPGDQIEIHLIEDTLPKATFLKVQPHDSAFLTIPDHKTQLEKALQCFSTVSVGSVINVIINEEPFELSIINGLPGQKYLSLRDTDVAIEFEAPLDFVESKPDDWPRSEEWPLPQGVRISEERLTNPKEYVLSNGRHVIVPPRPTTPVQPSPDRTRDTSTSPKFIPFSGKGHRLGS